MNDTPSKRKPRQPKKTLVEKRLESGVALLKTADRDASRGVIWTFSDTGRVARADICERLLRAGRLIPQGDGLFPDDSQSWRLA
jgi:hypothetical protein